jgi:hypothetical protein
VCSGGCNKSSNMTVPRMHSSIEWYSAPVSKRVGRDGRSPSDNSCNGQLLPCDQVVLVALGAESPPLAAWGSAKWVYPASVYVLQRGFREDGVRRPQHPQRSRVLGCRFFRRYGTALWAIPSPAFVGPVYEDRPMSVAGGGGRPSTEMDRTVRSP